MVQKSYMYKKLPHVYGAKTTQKLVITKDRAMVFVNQFLVHYYMVTILVRLVVAILDLGRISTADLYLRQQTQVGGKPRCQKWLRLKIACLQNVIGG
jgi:hypothetical protein